VSPALAIQSGVTGVLVVGLFATAIVLLTVLLARRRRDSWRRFASRHGLSLKRDRDGRPRVEGNIDGSSFILELSEASSDTGLGGVQEEKMSLEVGGSLPAGLVVFPRVPGSDPDAFATVNAEDEEEAERWLDKRRSQALEEFFAAADRDLVGIENGRVFRRRRQAVSKVEDLESRLESLVRIAKEVSGI
jgi:hypothetical protein